MTTNDKNNLYYQFIEILKQKQEKGFSPDTLLHQHHIEPKYAGGDPNGELVVCTIRDHARAHFIRYKVYKDTYDLCAYYGLVNKTDSLAKIIQEKIMSTNRKRGNCMFNPEWQKIMANRPKSSYYLQQNPNFARDIGQKGGKIGGTVMSDLKRKVLQQNGYNVGIFHGRAGGLKHQNSMTKQRLSLYLEWEHETGVQTISPPFESVQELKDYLNCFVVDSVKHISGLSGLLRNVNRQRYGWKIVRDLDI